MNKFIDIFSGCFMENSDKLTRVGDVKYINDLPFMCSLTSDLMISFNGLLGCNYDGRFKRFMEVWRDNDDSNPIMRRCTWRQNSDGTIKESAILSYACIDGTSIIPLNKIVQRSNGEYFKCVPSESIKFNEATIVNTQIAANKDYQIEKLELRPLNEFDEEFNRFKAKKIARRNLVEYYGYGKRESSQRIFQQKMHAEEDNLNRYNCTNLLTFCHHLTGYCSFQPGPSGFI